jgi:FeS assembly SUF system protein
MGCDRDGAAERRLTPTPIVATPQLSFATRAIYAPGDRRHTRIADTRTFMFSWFGKRQSEKPAASRDSDRDAAVTATALSDALPEAETRPGAAAAATAAAATVAAETAEVRDAFATDTAPADATHSLNVDAFLAPPSPTATANEQPAYGPIDAVQTDALKPAIVEAISTVFDPEIPVNIYELGLIYEVIVDAERRVGVRMTLTSPACPSAQQLPSEVRYKVKAVPGVAECSVEVIWEPPWTKEMMSEAAKLSLGIF